EPETGTVGPWRCSGGVAGGRDAGAESTNCDGDEAEAWPEGRDAGAESTVVMARRAGFRYSRWDGTQTGFDLDAESLLDEMSDDLLYHGDLNAALRRMMQQGFRDRNDERLMGLREMLERLRERRRQELESRDLGGGCGDAPDTA